MATIKEFLVKLEAPDGNLLREYRGKQTKKGRKEVAVREGLSEKQANTLQADDLATIRAAIEKESGAGDELLFVIMLD